MYPSPPRTPGMSLTQRRANAIYPINRYVRPLVHAARMGQRAYSVGQQIVNRHRAAKSNAARAASSGGAPLYGATFTSKVAYKKRRPNRKRKKYAKKSFKRFLRNSMRLQNPQNTISHNAFLRESLQDKQQWGSLDILNASAMYNLVRGQVPPFQTGSPPIQTQLRDFELHLKSFSCKFFLQNSGSVNMYIDLYYVYPRFDINWTQMGYPAPLGTTNGNTLANYVQAGVSTDQLPDQNNDVKPDGAELGVTAFQYENFCRQFVISKVRSLVLAPGQIYEERRSVNNKRINLSRIMNTADVTIPKCYVKGLSHTVLWRQRGFPGNLIEAAATQLNVGWEETACTKVIQTRPGSMAKIPDQA